MKAFYHKFGFVTADAAIWIILNFEHPFFPNKFNKMWGINKFPSIISKQSLKLFCHGLSQFRSASPSETLIGSFFVKLIGGIVGLQFENTNLWSGGHIMTNGIRLWWWQLMRFIWGWSKMRSKRWNCMERWKRDWTDKVKIICHSRWRLIERKLKLHHTWRRKWIKNWMGLRKWLMTCIWHWREVNSRLKRKRRFIKDYMVTDIHFSRGVQTKTPFM